MSTFSIALVSVLSASSHSCTGCMELGTGNMDLDSLMAQALAVDVDAVILESHRNWVDNSPVKSFQLSAKYLAQKF